MVKTDAVSRWEGLTGIVRSWVVRIHAATARRTLPSVVFPGSAVAEEVFVRSSRVDRAGKSIVMGRR